MGRIGVVTDGSADAGKFIGCDRGPDATAAHQHAPFGLLIQQSAPDGFGKIRIIDGLAACRTQVEYGMSELAQIGCQFLLERKTCVIGTDGHAHPSSHQRHDRVGRRSRRPPYLRTDRLHYAPKGAGLEASWTERPRMGREANGRQRVFTSHPDHRPLDANARGVCSTPRDPRGRTAGGCTHSAALAPPPAIDRKSTRLNSSHVAISYA